MERDFQKLKLDARQLSAELKTASVELKELKERNRTLTDDVTRFAVQNKELEKRLETRISEDFKIAAAAKTTNARLEKDLLALQNELAELRGNSDSYKNELLNASRKNKSLEGELLSLRNKNADLSVRLDSTLKQLKKLECFDDVVITRKAMPQDLDKHPEFRKFIKDEASESDYAVFSNMARKLTLTGRPIVSSNKDILKGKTIEILFENAAAGALQD